MSEAVEQAAEWLREALADGPRKAAEVTAAAAAEGFSEKHLRRARTALGISRESGTVEQRASGWWMKLPDQEAAPAEEPEEREAALSWLRGRLAGGEPVRLALLMREGQAEGLSREQVVDAIGWAGARVTTRHAGDWIDLPEEEPAEPAEPLRRRPPEVLAHVNGTGLPDRPA